MPPLQTWKKGGPTGSPVPRLWPLHHETTQSTGIDFPEEANRAKDFFDFPLSESLEDDELDSERASLLVSELSESDSGVYVLGFNFFECVETNFGFNDCCLRRRV